MLGETPLPSQPRSVFDFLSQKDRERLEKVRDTLQAKADGYIPEPASAPAHVPGEVVIPELHPSIAKAALSGFQPFTADPLKQARYNTFLTFASSAAPDKRLGMGPSPGQSVDEFNKELADYAKSAAVFKPLSGAMASRFQSAAVVEMGPKVVEGLHTPVVSTPPEPEEAEKKDAKQDEDPRMAAVRLGMYGPLTRELSAWQPARLLCKRFGVREPEVDASETDAAQSAVRAQETATPQAGTSAAAPLAITDGSETAAESSEQHKGPRNLANVGLGEDDDQGRDTLTYQRPAMDVFKAIFASDDEDSDDEDDGKPTTEVKSPISAQPSAPSTSPADEAPAYLRAGPSTQPAYQPNGSAVVPNPAPESKDMTTFKPTFVPRAEREARNEKSKDHDKDREKRKDKERKKKHAKTLVSFDNEDGEEGLQVVPKREKRKHKDKDSERKKKKVEKKADDDDDNMWVEAPAPEVVQQLDFTPAPIPATDEPSSEAPAGPPRGRKRAIDFM